MRRREIWWRAVGAIALPPYLVPFSFALPAVAIQLKLTHQTYSVVGTTLAPKKRLNRTANTGLPDPIRAVYNMKAIPCGLKLERGIYAG